MSLTTYGKNLYANQVLGNVALFATVTVKFFDGAAEIAVGGYVAQDVANTAAKWPAAVNADPGHKTNADAIVFPVATVGYQVTKVQLCNGANVIHDIVLAAVKVIEAGKTPRIDVGELDIFVA